MLQPDDGSPAPRRRRRRNGKPAPSPAIPTTMENQALDQTQDLDLADRKIAALGLLLLSHLCFKMADFAQAKANEAREARNARREARNSTQAPQKQFRSRNPRTERR